MSGDPEVVRARRLAALGGIWYSSAAVLSFLAWVLGRSDGAFPYALIIHFALGIGTAVRISFCRIAVIVVTVFSVAFLTLIMVLAVVENPDLHTLGIAAVVVVSLLVLAIPPVAILLMPSVRKGAFPTRYEEVAKMIRERRSAGKPASPEVPGDASAAVESGAGGLLPEAHEPKSPV